MKTIAPVLPGAACAGAPLEPVATSPTKLAPAPRSFDARSWVGDYVNAAECETAARRLHNDEPQPGRSEEHTSELQSHLNLVCRLLLEKKKKHTKTYS